MLGWGVSLDLFTCKLVKLYKKLPRGRPQWWYRVRLSPPRTRVHLAVCPCQHVPLAPVFSSDPPDGCAVVCLVVLQVCVFLMTNDVEPAFVSVFTICIYFWVRSLLESFAYLKILVCFLSIEF